MRTTKNKRAVIVGIFIFLGLAIFILGVLILGGQQKTFVKSIVLKTVFNDVIGLQTGNNVWFSGVKIGTVKQIEFYGESQVQITMNVQQEAQKFIHKDAMVKISTDGFIGNKILVIFGGGSAAEVQEGDVLKAYESATTDELFETLQKNNLNILDITSDFKKISARVAAGEGSIGQLLNDDQLVREIQAMVKTLQKTSANTERLSSNLVSYTEKLDDKGTLAGDLVTDTTIMKNLREATTELRAMAATAQELTNNLKTATESVNNKNTPVGVILHDQEFASQLKRTMENLETGTQKLDENMEALQSNFLFRGFFRKKAKAEKQPD